MSWLLAAVPRKSLSWLYGKLSENTTGHKLLEVGHDQNADGLPIKSQTRQSRRHASERHATRAKSDSVSSDQNSKVSILSHPEGDLEILGGEFNGVAGNQFRVQVNVNGCHSQGSGSRKRTAAPMACDEAGMDIEGDQDVENEGSQALSSECMHSLPIPEDLEIGSSRLVQQVSEEPYTIYYRCLATRERGSPLWIPEPNKQLSVDYQRNGLVIGDVGIITNQGCFDSLFNISLPTNHPLAINTDDLPQNFAPLEIKPSHILISSKFKQGASLSSGSVSVTSGLTFESSASEGAILTLPDGSSSEDLRNQKILRDYLAVHLEEIYRCALIKHGREINNGDLRIVTGFDKTATWGMAAFSNSTSQRKPSFRLEFLPRDQGCVGQTHSWKSSGAAEVKAGPDTQEVVDLRMGEPSQQDVEYKNQAVFVRTQNPTLNPAIWNALLYESGAGEPQLDDSSDTPSDSSSSPSGGDGESPGSGNSMNDSTGHISASYSYGPSGSSFSTLAIHPSNALNAMLLKLNPSAQMAITGDDIWISVLKDDDTILPPFETLWSRILELYDVQLEDGVVFLEKAEADVSPISVEPATDGLELGCDYSMILDEEIQPKSREQKVKTTTDVRDGVGLRVHGTVPHVHTTHPHLVSDTNIIQQSTDLPSHYGIPQPLPVPSITPRTASPITSKPSSPVIPDFQTLANNYLDMLKDKSTEATLTPSSALVDLSSTTSTTLHDDGFFNFDMPMTTHVGRSDLDDFTSSPFLTDDSPYSDVLLKTPILEPALSMDYSDVPLFPEVPYECEGTSNVEQKVRNAALAAFNNDLNTGISPMTWGLKSFAVPSTSRRIKASGIDKGKSIIPDSLVDEHAPTQPRKHRTPSVTSRKEIPAVFERKRSRSTAFGDVEEEDDLDDTSTLPPNPTEKDLIEQKRRLNTLAARRSRRRKLEQSQMLEESLREARINEEIWKERANVMSQMLRERHVPIPDWPADEETLQGRVQHEM